MEQDFEKKIKSKRKRGIAIAVLVVLIIGGIVLTTNIEGAKFAVKKLMGNNKVTVEIRCDELSQDMSLLTKDGIAKYVPEDGTILAETECAFEKGETVFDALKRICREKDIQMESAYTPVYKSYYIEGMNYLYTGDAGKMSGWVYTVNGEQTDYACSDYELTGGEKIVWQYVCTY